MQFRAWTNFSLKKKMCVGVYVEYNCDFEKYWFF